MDVAVTCLCAMVLGNIEPYCTSYGLLIFSGACVEPWGRSFGCEGFVSLSARELWFICDGIDMARCGSGQKMLYAANQVD